MGASILLDRPPGGWNDLATKASLAALEARLDARFEQFEHQLASELDRRFSDAFAGQLRSNVGSMIALAAVLVAALKL